MSILNRYILSLAVAFMLTTVVLASFGGEQLDAYFVLYVIEYLAITLLYTYLSPVARRLLSGVALVLSAGFGAIVVARVMQILLGPSP